MINIGVNDGHTISGPGSGAIGKISESEHTRLVGNEVRRQISERGYNAINCTVDYAATQGEALSAIVTQANREDLEWFIAIHFNAAGGRGVECYTYEGRQYPDAIEICSNISALGFVNRGVKSGTGLYVVRKTKAKAVLVEVCFVDSEDADHYLEVGHQAIAKAIVDALVGYVEVTPQPVIVQPEPIPQPAPAVKKTWEDYIVEPISGQLQAAINAVYGTDLDVDNKLGDQTFGAIKHNHVVVRAVQANPLVAVIQKRLMQLGYGLSRYGADGKMSNGGETEKAIIRFQTNRGLTVDGEAGINTIKELFKK